ncbi:MAG: hypothetical protein RLY86_609 [Pseudomonadota bacterium]|jgi:transcriptional regulator with XRE-family HTH domain
METTKRRGRRGPRQDAADTAVSVALGERVRQRRGLLGVSQQELSRRVGLTFQQIQKYERGHNRISVPALVKIAAALETTPGAFLEGLGKPVPSAAQAGGTLDREAMALLGASRQLPETIRRAMLDLARSLADSGRDADAGVDAAMDGSGGEDGGDDTADDADDPGDAGEELPGTPESAREIRARMKGAMQRRRRRGAVWDPADIYRAS